MKKLALIAVAAVVSVLFVQGPVMAHVAKTKADHMAMADKYEKMAADQEAVAKEHTEMKSEYHAKWFPKQEREKAISEMDKHCDAIISESKKIADEYKALALWHKARAGDTE